MGGTLDAKDKFSFDVSSINSKEEWDALVEKALKEAEEKGTIPLRDLVRELGD